MDIHLTPETEKLVERCVVDGLGRTPDEAVSKGLHLLMSQAVVCKPRESDSQHTLDAFAGCLLNDDALTGDSLEIQRAVRDEW